ncbi:MAG: hypothetical protein R2828_22655 [Saprospiraceae bacterium]
MIKRLLHTILFVLLVLSTGFSQQVEKILVKSFNLQGKQTVELDLDGPIEVKTWKNDILRVQMSVSLQNGSESILKSLVQVGRYNLKSDITDEKFSIYLPTLEKEVKIRGTLLEEQVSFLVFVPENVEVKLTNTAASSAQKTSAF